MEGISLEELQLAARNHGMPLEALRYPVTPVGLHYLLIHYDVPAVDAGRLAAEIGGAWRRSSCRSTSCARAPRVEQTVTMECAGNGRARLEPRPVSQPWLLEAVGTARWRGTPLAPLLEEAGVPDGTVEVLFTGLDRGIEGGDEQAFQRALALEEAMRDEMLLAYEMNGAPLPPQHGFPLRLVVPGWYGMTNVKWLSRIEVPRRAVRRLPAVVVVPGAPVRGRGGRAAAADAAALAARAARDPGVHDARAHRRGRARCCVEGRAWSGLAPVASVEVSDDGGATWAEAELEPAGEPWAWRGWSFRWDAQPGEHVLCSRARDEAGNEQPVEPRLEPRRLREQRGADGARHRHALSVSATAVNASASATSTTNPP